MRGPATIGELSGSRPRRRAARGTRGHRAAGRGRLRRDNYTASEHANHFSYDAMLRRTAVEDSAGVRYFTWDTNGMNLLAERDATGTVVAAYTHGRAAVDGIGSCVGQKLVQSGATYYEFDVHDHRGTVVRRVNDAGQVTGYFEYDAWGNYLRDEETGASSRFRYQSNWIELKDSGGELYLSPTRIYSATHGRYLSRDWTDGLVGSYVGWRSEPTLAVDPDGGVEVVDWLTRRLKDAIKAKLDALKRRALRAVAGAATEVAGRLAQEVVDKGKELAVAPAQSAHAVLRETFEYGQAAGRKIGAEVWDGVLRDVERTANLIQVPLRAIDRVINCLCSWAPNAAFGIGTQKELTVGFGLGVTLNTGHHFDYLCATKQVCFYSYVGAGAGFATLGASAAKLVKLYYSWNITVPADLTNVFASYTYQLAYTHPVPPVPAIGVGAAGAAEFYFEPSKMKKAWWTFPVPAWGRPKGIALGLGAMASSPPRLSGSFMLYQKSFT